MSIQKEKIEELSRLIEIEPHRAELYVQHGSYHYESGYTLEHFDHSGYTKEINGVTYNDGYAKSIDDYTKAIELNPLYAKSYRERGICYERLNCHDEAMADFNRAIGLAPDWAVAYVNRALAYNK